jgi:hypothetical protein
MTFTQLRGLLLLGVLASAALAANACSSSSSGSTTGGDAGTTPPPAPGTDAGGVPQDAGGTPQNDAGSADASADGSSNDAGGDAAADRCAAYNTCMSTNCDQQGGDFLTLCAAFTDPQYTCRLQHCGFAASGKNGVHCDHAVGVGGVCP